MVEALRAVRGVERSAPPLAGPGGPARGAPETFKGCGPKLRRMGLRGELLRLLEEDREFRHAVMGLLGYRELLERFARLEERFAKLEEEFAKLGERQLALQERQQRLEERFAKLEERYLALEERVARVEERLAKAEELLVEVWRELGEVRRLAEASRRDVGALSEAVYSRFVWEDLRAELEGRGERVVSRRRGVRIEGEEVDMLVETPVRIYVVEVKVQPNHRDVDALLRKASAAERAFGRPATPVLAGVWIGGEVRSYAESRGVEVYEC